jgi:anthranilate phosphoribosyltransferase
MRPCAADLLRRIDAVHIDVQRRPARAVATGITHRLPATVPITLAAAARLSALGVPVVVHNGPDSRGD